MLNFFAIALIVISIFLAPPRNVAAAPFAFRPGDYYGPLGDFAIAIVEWDRNGKVVGSLNISSSIFDDLRGMIFGPDHLLYVTQTQDLGGFRVRALDSDDS